MGCGSCGGSRMKVANPQQVAAGVAAPVYRARYVWRWVSKDRSEKKDFESENAAKEWASTNPGSVSVVDSNSH